MAECRMCEHSKTEAVLREDGFHYHGRSRCTARGWVKRRAVDDDWRPESAFVGRLSTPLFHSLLFDELAIREGFGRRGGFALPVSVERSKKLLRRLADQMVEAAHGKGINPVNLLYIFLNRYYAIFVKNTPLNKIVYHWDAFSLELGEDAELMGLLNYDDERRRLICGIIGEMREAKDSRALEEFLRTACEGKKVAWPQHFTERSRLFEAVLRSVPQMEAGLGWFMTAHAIEILKAHALALQVFSHAHGDKIKLHLGNFYGEAAMGRLRAYLAWRSRRLSEHPGVDL